MKITVKPPIVGAFRTIYKGLEKIQGKLEIRGRIETIVKIS